ncbi:MAG: deoxyribodipyrimidine photo-lyase [Candidatus Rhabdochlamydia sp.]
MGPQKFKKTLFIFRRDLRLEDNNGLAYALTHSETVIPCFIFTPEQVENNPYKGTRSLQFMIECLEDLEQALHAHGATLYLFYGTPSDVVKTCIEELQIDSVIFNQDYTPYSQKRDHAIETVCTQHHVSCLSFEDLLLHPTEQLLKQDGSAYVVFTPFYHHAASFPINQSNLTSLDNYFKHPISFAKSQTLYHQLLPSRHNQLKGGRKEGLQLLKQLGKDKLSPPFYLGQPVTHLSPHLKFTTCSIREVYAAFKHHHQDVRALYWRDFFSTIALKFPHVFKGAFHPEFDALEWSEDLHAFKTWCEGMTGFPLVDAGLRELNQTGLMHNRARMVTASFLIKDLHLNWQWGEKYFANHLIDYDPAVNNGNWQWVASTGCDRQPYFRIFNPWLQQKKFDPDCLYIKQWIPELQEVPCHHIHTWESSYTLYPHLSYPRPCLNHSDESKLTLKAYQQISRP